MFFVKIFLGLYCFLNHTFKYKSLKSFFPFYPLGRCESNALNHQHPRPSPEPAPHLGPCHQAGCALGCATPWKALSPSLNWEHPLLKTKSNSTAGHVRLSGLTKAISIHTFRTIWGDLPGGPAVETQGFHCRVCGFNRGTEISHTTWCGQKKKRIIAVPWARLWPHTEVRQKDNKTRKGMQQQDTVPCFKLPSPRLLKRNQKRWAMYYAYTCIAIPSWTCLISSSLGS